jgi:hypothetical protein
LASIATTLAGIATTLASIATLLVATIFMHQGGTDPFFPVGYDSLWQCSLAGY